MHSLDAVLGLMALGVAGSMLAQRLRTPAPSVLVLLGLGIGLLPGVPALHVPPEAVTLGVLPPLLFAAAQDVSLKELAAVWRPVAALAVGLVVVTAIAVAAAAHAVDPSLALSVTFTLGALLASTDPVAVTALARELRLPGRVATVVQSESLFNDATSLVLFQVAVAVVVTGHSGVSSSAWRLVRLGGGGVLIGVVVGLLAGALLRRRAEPTVQAAVSLLTPYVAAVVADELRVSSVTAVIVTGLWLGRRHHQPIDGAGRLTAASVYAVVVLLLENAVFAVIGLELATFARELSADAVSRTLATLAAVTATLLVVRALALAVVALAGGARRDSTGAAPWRSAAVVAWAGARGVIPLAAALSIPATVSSGGGFPHRPELMVVAIGAVVVSLVVQGTTLRPLVRRLGMDDAAAADDDVLRGRRLLAQAALQHLDGVAAQTEASEHVVGDIRDQLEDRLRRAAASPGDSDELSGEAARQELVARVHALQVRELQRLRATGELSDQAGRALQRELDLDALRRRG